MHPVGLGLQVAGHHPGTQPIEVQPPTALPDGAVDAVLAGLALLVNLVLFPLGYYHHDPASPLSPCAAQTLHQSDGALGRVEADDEVHLTNVQSFLSHACGYKGIVATRSELADNLEEITVEPVYSGHPWDHAKWPL